MFDTKNTKIIKCKQQQSISQNQIRRKENKAVATQNAPNGLPTREMGNSR